MFRLLLLPALLVAACYPNPDDLRGSSARGGSSGAAGSGGSKTGSGGRTGGGGGVSGVGGATGTGGRGGSSGVAGGNGSGGAGAGGYTGAGTSLAPDANGHVAKTANAFGIQGYWYAFADGIGADGTTAAGICERAGHPASSCSQITSPLPGAFTNSGGKMCTTGSVALVLPNVSGMPDFGNMWGASMGFDFNYDAAKGTFNAITHGITGISFDLDAIPANGLRVSFPTPSSDGTVAGSAYWGATPSYPGSPVKVGNNKVYWSGVTGPTGAGFDPTMIESMYFSVPTNTTAAGSFKYCVSNVTALTDTAGATVTCTDPKYPVPCAALGSTPASCWAAGTNCLSIAICSGSYLACTDASRHVDCTSKQCVDGPTCVDPSYPVPCPALGTVPAACWSPGSICSTVTNCSGIYHSCITATYHYDCASAQCLPPGG